MGRRRYLGLATATLAGLAGCLGETEYTVADVAVGDTSAPLGLDVTVVDDAATIDSNARLDVTLRNEGERAVEVRNTGVWPLGMLALAPSNGRGPNGIVLPSAQYAETERIEVTANGASLDGEPIVRPLHPGESVTGRYEIDGNRLSGPGTYTLRGHFEEVPLSYRVEAGGDWTGFHPEVTITLTERSVVP